MGVSYNDRGMTDRQWEILMQSIWNIERMLEAILKQKEEADKKSEAADFLEELSKAESRYTKEALAIFRMGAEALRLVEKHERAWQLMDEYLAKPGFPFAHEQLRKLDPARQGATKEILFRRFGRVS